MRSCWVCVAYFLSRVIVIATLLLALPAQAHDHYSEWRRPDNGQSCCSNTDCDAVTVRRVGGQWLVTWRGQELPASDATLLDVPSPDGRAHACVIAGIVRC